MDCSLYIVSLIYKPDSRESHIPHFISIWYVFRSQASRCSMESLTGEMNHTVHYYSHQNAYRSQQAR